MKKRIVTMVIISILAFCLCSCGKQETISAEPDNVSEGSGDVIGGWSVPTIVDEFGDPIESEDKVIAYSFSGDFSNTATKSSLLTGVVSFYDTRQEYNTLKNKAIFFELNEYGDTPITFYNGDQILLKTKIDNEIETYELSGTPPTSNLYLDSFQIGPAQPYSNERLYDVLCTGKDIRCIITIGSSQYNFTIGSENIVDASIEAGIDPYYEITIDSFQNALQANTQQQQLLEVEEYLNANCNNYQQLSGDEIVNTFTNSVWLMYGVLGGKPEKAIFNENTIEGEFCNTIITSDNGWSVMDNTLIAYHGMEYAVYKIEDDYYLLKTGSTCIIAEKTE